MTTVKWKSGLKLDDTEDEINKTLEGTGLKVNIYETMELYGVEDDMMDENDEDFGKPMYEAMLMDKDGNQIDDTMTGRFVDIRSVAHEVREYAEKYAGMKMALLVDGDNKTVCYMATGIEDENGLFTGEVFGYLGGDSYGINYMYKGKFLPDITNDGQAVEDDLKEELFEFLVGDDTFLTRCWEVSNTLISPQRTDENFEYTVDNPSQHSPEKLSYYKGDIFNTPTYGDNIFPEQPYEVAHTSDTLLGCDDMKATVDQFKSRGGLRGLVESPLFHFLKPEELEIMGEYIEGKTVNPFADYSANEKEVIGNAVFSCSAERSQDTTLSKEVHATLLAISKGEEIRIKQVPSMMEDLNTKLEEAVARVKTEDDLAMREIDMGIVDILSKAKEDCVKALEKKQSTKEKKEVTAKQTRGM